jgi:hypothetical protein
MIEGSGSRAGSGSIPLTNGSGSPITCGHCFQEGLSAGQKRGFKEGLALGSQKGVEIGAEVGFYAGFAAGWIERLEPVAEDSTGAAGGGEKRQKVAGQLRKLLALADSFPADNIRDLDILDRLLALRAKFKIVCSLLKVQLFVNFIIYRQFSEPHSPFSFSSSRRDGGKLAIFQRNWQD